MREDFAKSELNKYSLEAVRSPFNYDFRASYNKDNLSVSFNAFSLFYNRHSRKETLTECYEDHSDILSLGNYYNLSLAYTFNLGKRIPFVKKNIDERVESSVLHSN